MQVQLEATTDFFGFHTVHTGTRHRVSTPNRTDGGRGRCILFLANGHRWVLDTENISSALALGL